MDCYKPFGSVVWEDRMLTYSSLRFLPRLFFKGRRPIHLTFFITNRCNARCPYCFYREELNQDKDLLTIVEIEKVVRSFRSPLLWLLLSGGEPFLHPAIDTICRLFYHYTRPSFIVIPTGCTLPRIIEQKMTTIIRDCPNSRIVLKASLDGWGKEHDRLRGVPGNFNRFLETIDRVGPLTEKYKNFDLGVNSVFLPENEDRMTDLYRKVRQFPSVRLHTVNLVRGAQVGHQWRDVDMEKYRELGRIMGQDALGHKGRRYHFFLSRLKAAQNLLEKELIYQTVRRRRRQLPCYAGRLNLVLSETGDVFPCEMLDWKCGNVREARYDLEKIIFRREVRDYLTKIRQGTPQCHTCTHECNLATNILFNPFMLMKTAALAVHL